MNDYSKELTIKLYNNIYEECIRFFSEMLSDPSSNDSDIINIILSAHLSSLSNLMLKFSEDHEEMNVIVKTFLAELLEKIAELHPIKNVEII